MASIEVDFTCQFTIHKREGVSDEEAVEEASEAVQRALSHMEGVGFDYDNDVLESLLVAQWVGEDVQLGSEDLTEKADLSSLPAHQLEAMLNTCRQAYNMGGQKSLELRRRIDKIEEELDLRLSHLDQ